MANKPSALETKYRQVTEDLPGLIGPRRERLVTHALAHNKVRQEPISPATMRLAGALIGASQGQTSEPAAVAEAEALLNLPKYGPILAGLQDALIILRQMDGTDLGNRLLVGSVRGYCEHIAREAASVAARLKA
jgi:hypothetical protein